MNNYIDYGLLMVVILGVAFIIWDLPRFKTGLALIGLILDVGWNKASSMDDKQIDEYLEGK